MPPLLQNVHTFTARTCGYDIYKVRKDFWASLGGSVVGGNVMLLLAQETHGLISGLGRFSGEKNGNPIRILAWKSRELEEPGGYTVHEVTKELDMA